MVCSNICCLIAVFAAAVVVGECLIVRAERLVVVAVCDSDGWLSTEGGMYDGAWLWADVGWAPGEGGGRGL